MNYFTPNRFLALGNLDDDKALLAAHDEWEQAIEDYQGHLQAIRSKLPVGLRRLIGSVYLHDARVLDMWEGDRSRFTVTLHPESDPSHLVVLAYSLVESPRFDHDALPADVRSQLTAWLRFRTVSVARPLAILPDQSGRNGLNSPRNAAVEEATRQGA